MRLVLFTFEFLLLVVLRLSFFIRTGPGTLGRVLIDNPAVQTFRLLEKRRVRLEGEELDEFMKTKLKEHKVKIKEELM